MKKILIIGATSAIAEAVARRYAAEGSRLYLLARNAERLEVMAADLPIRGAEAVAGGRFEADAVEAYPDLLEKALAFLGGIDVVLVAHGTLGNQGECEASVEKTLQEIRNNATSTIALLTILANMMEKQRRGTIAVISSVAGDRGRPSNYVYGSAKAAVTGFCEGLRARMFKVGVRVLTIKPGMVDTPMTEGLDLPAALLASQSWPAAMSSARRGSLPGR